MQRIPVIGMPMVCSMVVGVDADPEVGPEYFQVVAIELSGGLVFEEEIFAADADDAVHLAGEDEARPGVGGWFKTTQSMARNCRIPVASRQ